MYPATAHAVLAESESSISRLLQSLSEVAPENILAMDVTLLTSKASGWLNEDASRNMPDMAATLLTSQESGWSKSPAR